MPILKTPAARGVVLLVLLGAIPVAAAGVRLGWFIAGDVTPGTLRFATSPLPVLAHVIAVFPFALLGAGQFAPATRRTAWHRRSGYVVWGAGLVLAVSGLWMSLAYALPPEDRTTTLLIARLASGLWMLFALVAALSAIRARDIARHRAFMIRAWAVGMGAGTQALMGIPVILIASADDPVIKALYMSAGWIVNVIAAEILIRRPMLRPRARALPT